MKTVHARTLGLRIAVLAAAGLMLTACNEDDVATGAAGGQTSPSAVASAHPSASASGKGKEPAKPSARPSNTATGGDTAAAQKKTDKLALTAEEWDNAFVSDGDDDTGVANFVMDKSCVYKADGTNVNGLVASTFRYVRQDHESDSTFANTVASQFTTVDAAAKDVAEQKAITKRCTDYTDGSNKYQSVHDIESPKVPGADEVYSEEGLAVYRTSDGGQTDPRPFSYIIARKGSLYVSVLVDVDPQRQIFEGRAQAREALKKMTAKW
ncbi:hypothetical protein ACFV4P_26320 [Kitasatospora sp. NPDC059795]|uniref:hypothetical protein n=1 Tax=Kitasatospora sp. NPDC059795 TaxID=3346949 RepID=UPI00365CE7AE